MEPAFLERQPGAEHARGVLVAVGVERQPLRGVDQLLVEPQRPAGVAGAGEGPRLAEHGADGRAGVAGLLRRLGGAPAEHRGFGVAVDLGGPPGGFEQVGKALDPLAGAPVVLGDLGDQLRVAARLEPGFEQGGEGPVESVPARLFQPGVEAPPEVLAGEGVEGGVALVAALQEAAADQVGQVAVDRVGVAVEQPRQGLQAEGSADDRRRFERDAERIGQGVEPLPIEGALVPGQAFEHRRPDLPAALAQDQAALVDRVAQELLDAPRQPAAPVDDPLEHGVRQRVAALEAEARLEQAGGGVRSEGVELEERDRLALRRPAVVAVSPIRPISAVIEPIGRPGRQHRSPGRRRAADGSRAPAPARSPGRRRGTAAARRSPSRRGGGLRGRAPAARRARGSPRPGGGRSPGRTGTGPVRRRRSGSPSAAAPPRCPGGRGPGARAGAAVPARLRRARGPPGLPGPPPAGGTPAAASTCRPPRRLRTRPPGWCLRARRRGRRSTARARPRGRPGGW